MNIHTKILKILFISILTLMLSKFLALIISYQFFYEYESNKILKDDKTIIFSTYKILKESNNKVKVNKIKIDRTKKIDTTIINEILLKAIFIDKERKIIILMLKKKGSEAMILNEKDLYEGFVIEKINKNDVLLSKNNKLYSIYFLQNELVTKKELYINNKEETFDYSNDGIKQLSKNDINYYKKNPKEIFKEIKINDYKENGKLIGFKVHKVKKNGVFFKLGLKKNDIIVEINGKKMNSYKNALKIYHDIKKIDRIEMLIKRNNSYENLEYELY